MTIRSTNLSPCIATARPDPGYCLDGEIDNFWCNILFLSHLLLISVIFRTVRSRLSRLHACTNTFPARFPRGESDQVRDCAVHNDKNSFIMEDSISDPIRLKRLLPARRMIKGQTTPGYWFSISNEIFPVQVLRVAKPLS